MWQPSQGLKWTALLLVAVIVVVAIVAVVIVGLRYRKKKTSKQLMGVLAE